MLTSDQPDDTAVLLSSFELEQVLEDIPAGEPRPKVQKEGRKEGREGGRAKMGCGQLGG